MTALVSVTQGGSSGSDALLVVGVALIAATAALLGAIIAAKTAGSRQREQLAHERKRQEQALAAERERHRESLAAEAARFERQLEADGERERERLAHDREIRDLDETRRQVSEVMMRATSMARPMTHFQTRRRLAADNDSDETQEAAREAERELRAALIQQRRDAVALSLLLGEHHPVVSQLVATNDAVHKVLNSEDIEAGDKADSEHTDEVAALIGEAHTLIGAFKSPAP